LLFSSYKTLFYVTYFLVFLFYLCSCFLFSFLLFYFICVFAFYLFSFVKSTDHIRLVHDFRKQKGVSGLKSPTSSSPGKWDQLYFFLFSCFLVFVFRKCSNMYENLHWILIFNYSNLTRIFIINFFLLFSWHLN
jgi:hypothetical protein